jgi:hypothetical protein
MIKTKFNHPWMTWMIEMKMDLLCAIFAKDFVTFEQIETKDKSY